MFAATLSRATSICPHPDGRLVATGEIGKKPIICVWDADTVTAKHVPARRPTNLTPHRSILKDGHAAGVGSLAFSTDGKVTGACPGVVR